MWFEELTGFQETTPDEVRSKLIIKGEQIVSKENNASYKFGRLEVASLETLRSRTATLSYNSKIKVSEIVANVQTLHVESANNGASFQAASQFNLLEMMGPHISPEMGIDMYENEEHKVQLAL